MSRNSFGFTMVEVMVVLLILGMVAAVAVPSINSTLDEMKIDGAAREVVSALYYGQSLAIKEGKDFAVQFHNGQNRFWCFDKATGLKVLHLIDKKPYEIDFRDEGHFQGVDIVSAQFGVAAKSSVSFNSLGEFSDFGTVILGYSGRQRTINVTGLLGEVSVN